MNYLFFDRNGGKNGVLGKSGIIKVLTENWYFKQEQLSFMLDKVKLGQYFYIGSVTIVAVSDGISRQDFPDSPR